MFLRKIIHKNVHSPKGSIGKTFKNLNPRHNRANPPKAQIIIIALK